MALKVSGCSLPGTGHAMQDTWGTAGSFAWVIDGATRQDDVENSLVSMWVRRLSDALQSTITAHGSRPLLLNDLLSQAIHDAAIEPTPQGFHPSATIALAFLDDTHAHVLVLGDSAAVVEGNTLRDTRLAHVAKEYREQLRRLPDSALGKTRIRELLLNEEDRYRNTEDGFWVVNNDPTVVRKAYFGTFPEARHVILATDGLNDVDNIQSGQTPLRDEMLRLRHECIEAEKDVDDMAAVILEWS